MKNQENRKVVYFLRGLGVGIVITVVILALHNIGQPEKKASMSKEEIIQKAKEYGLVEPIDNKLDAILNSASPGTTASPEQTLIPQKTATPAKTPIPPMTASPKDS